MIAAIYSAEATMRLIIATNLMRFDPFSGIARFEPFCNIDDLFKDLRMMSALHGLESEPRIMDGCVENQSSLYGESGNTGCEERQHQGRHRRQPSSH